MKKIFSILFIIPLLASCNANDSSLSDDSTTSETPTLLKSHEYIFTDVLNNLSNAYETVTFKCDDSGFNFMNASHQSANISNVPVIDASMSENTYVTMLSDSLFDLTRIGMSITIYSEADKNYLGEDYFIGMEYLLNDEWIPVSSSLDKDDITVGALLSEEDIFYFNVEEVGVRKVRMRFNVPSNNGKIRFGIYSLYIEGYQNIITTNETTTSVTIANPSSLSLLVNEKMKLSVNVTASNQLDTPVLWSSSDRYIATVDEKGLVKGVTTGIVIITALSGNYSDTITLNVVDDLSVLGYVQPKVTFYDPYSLPNGFESNITESYPDSIKFANTDDYLLTPIYEEVGAKTRVNISLKHSSGNAEAADNIFAVEGININGEVVEEQTVKGVMSTSFVDINFDFVNTSIVRYLIYYKYKAIQPGASYPIGKNYGMRSLEIIKLAD